MSTSKLLVAAIDFGTSFSTWAYSFLHDYRQSPPKVYAKNWNSGDHISLKAPTTVLIRPDGETLKSFGYEAENEYAAMATENKHKGWHYFKNFKMKLYEEINLKRNIQLEDDQGHLLAAQTVFSLAIEYLKDDLLKETKTKLMEGTITEEDVHWVLTVPSIWNDAAKQFMRESAEQAGIKGKHLTIALEPEVASLYCKHLPLTLLSGISQKASPFGIGTKYIVLDAGGGTIDITIHEVISENGVKELHRASGGAWGGCKVDEAFTKVLGKIFGCPVMRKFKAEFPDDYIYLLRSFEVKKRDVSASKDTTITFSLPSTLKYLFEEGPDKNLKQTIARSIYAKEMELARGDKLRINSDVIKRLYDHPLESIVDHVRSLLQESNVQGISKLLLVGGFAESELLQETLRAKFPELNVVVPNEAGLAVIKGAVIYGHGPNVVIERKAVLTYGVKSWTKFDEKFDRADKLVVEHGERRCEDRFLKFVSVGQALTPGQKVCKQGLVPFTEGSECELVIYATGSDHPRYVTDLGCFRLGVLTVSITDRSVPVPERKFDVTLTFGNTELGVSAREQRTGKAVNAKLNFFW